MFYNRAMNWYGFLIGCGIVLCVIGAYFAAKHRGIEGDVVIDIIIIGLPFAILFARIYYVVFDVINPNTTNVWTFTKFIGIDDKGLSGLAIYGALIGVVIALFILSLWKKRKKNPENKRVSYLQLLDLTFTFVMFGQAIGRWGNFANSEAHGYEITDPSLMWFPFAVQGAGSEAGKWFYATFFYEFVWDLIGGCLLLFLYLGKRKSFDGFIISSYCIYYGIGRAWIEGMRSDSLWLVPPTVSGGGITPDVGGLRVSQLLSIILIVFGVVLIVTHIVRARRADKKVFIFVDGSKLCDDYFDYDKTKLAHPMPDIKFRKKKSEEDIIIDNNGVAIKLDTSSPSEARSDGVTEENKTETEESAKNASMPNSPTEKTEETYADRWDD